MVNSTFEFSHNLTKLTVLKEFIEALPGGRVVVGRVVQPVREHQLTTLLGVLFFCPHLKLLPARDHQVANISPLVDDRLL